MSFDDVLDELRQRLGTEVAVVLWLSALGPADGWLIDVDGTLRRIDDPIADVDQSGHYVRFESGNGFALERSRFRAAAWKSVAGERSLDVDCGAVTVSIRPYSPQLLG